MRCLLHDEPCSLQLCHETGECAFPTVCYPSASQPNPTPQELTAPTLEQFPMQPLVMAGNVLRFKENRIVSALLDVAGEHGLDLNAIACMDFEPWERQQLSQLIGYSVSGYGELSYVDDEALAKADKAAEKFIHE